MSDSRDLQIQPTPAVDGASAVQPVRSEGAVGTSGKRRPEVGEQAAAASTGGNLRAAYAQFIVNPDTHDVIIRVRDSATDQVLSEFPSPQVEAMAKYLRDYAETLTRHRAALRQGLAN
jgi:uncharacterized FlaG/YvyC family protein